MSPRAEGDIWQTLEVVALDTRTTVSVGTSLLLHLLVSLAAFAVHRSVAAEPPARDVWAGDTVDIDSLALEPIVAPVAADPGAAPSPKATDTNDGSDQKTDRAASPPSGAAGTEADPGSPPIPSSDKREPRSPSPATLTPNFKRSPTTAKQKPPSRAAAKRGRKRPVAEQSDTRSLAERIFSYRPKVDGAPAETASPAPVTPGGMTGAVAHRDLIRAFTRAIPAANTRDPAWNRLPLGAAGGTRVTLRIAADGSVVEAEHHGTVPPHLRRLVRRTLLALKGGVFGFKDSDRRSSTLRLSASISSKPVASGPLALGFEAPRDKRPGRAYFQLPSGRFIEVEVKQEP